MDKMEVARPRRPILKYEAPTQKAYILGKDQIKDMLRNVV